MTWHAVLIVTSIVLFIIGAILGFAWFHSRADLGAVLGVTCLGLVAFAAAHL